MRNYVKTPTILQMEDTECGAASLAMIFAYFGKYIPLERMRVETGVSRDGCNAGNIMRAAKKHGLHCRGFRKETEELRKIPKPCIIHWNFNHFVVLEGFKGKHVYINDPAVGRRKLTWNDLDECFTGVVLTFEWTEAFVKEKKERRTLRFISQRMKPYMAVICKIVYIGLLMVMPGLILPVLSQVFIDDILGAGYRDWLIRLLLFMAGCLVLKSGLSYYRSLILAKLKAKMTLVSGYHLLSHMFHLPMTFFDQRYTGDLVKRMSNDRDINDMLAGELGETVLNVFISLFYAAILVYYSPILTLIGIVSILISVGVSAIANKVIANATMKLQMSGGKLFGALCAGLSITDTIKASGVEQEYSMRLLGHQALNGTQEQELKRFQQMVSAVPQTVAKLTDVVILLVGAIWAIRGEFTVGMLIAYNSLFDSFCDPINQLISFFENLQTLKSNVHRVDDINRYPQEEKPKALHTVEKGKLHGDIELQDISFGYSLLKPPVVEHFSFDLSSGETIAFVGASGCGKTTVSKVISGLYKPWGGRVLLDRKDMYTLPESLLHRSVATVSQNTILFSGTIRENITMWNDAVLEDDMVAAAKDACIHDFIMQLPGAYDYKLDENGANLSGGQRQRLEIARSLAVNPSILIMDEATSALDPIVEKEIMDNIRRRGCTCVIVAHRLSTIRDCSKIVVMRDGRIVQSGTHASLMAEDNSYYRQFVSSN